MPAPYDYSNAAGYIRARPDWIAWPSVETVIRQSDLDRWDQAIYDLKRARMDIRDFGAKADGATDDTVAIQSAINAAATTGNVVQIAGTAIVNGGLTVGVTALPIMLEGVGGLHAGGHSSMLKRSSGSTAILTATGNGQATGQRSRLSVRNLGFHGGTLAGNLVKLYRVSEAMFHSVHFHESTGTALHGTELWNSVFENCRFSNCGNGTTSPVALFDAVATGLGSTDTVLMNDCQWEGNSGVLLKLTGDTVSVTPVNQFFLNNFKMEHNNTALLYPLVDNDYSQFVAVGNGNMTINNAASTAYFIKSGLAGSIGQSLPMKVSNVALDHSGSPQDFIVNHYAGLMLTGMSMTGNPTRSYMRSDVADAARPHNLITSGVRVEFNNKRFSDARTLGHHGDVLEDVVIPTLLNSWVNFDAANNSQAGYWKDPNGLVNLMGTVKSGTVATTIFQLPQSYWPYPNRTLYFPVDANGAFGEIIVAYDGRVLHSLGGNVRISLDGISFRAN